MRISFYTKIYHEILNTFNSAINRDTKFLDMFFKAANGNVEYSISESALNCIPDLMLPYFGFPKLVKEN